MSETDTVFVAKLRDTAWLPELPEEDAKETLYRLRDLERHIVIPADQYRQLGHLYKGDYDNGAAESDNAIEDIKRYDVPLAIAEHATDTIRNKDGEVEAADYGTGALALLLTERDGAAAIVTLGKQTEHLGTNSDLPFWEALRKLQPDSRGVASIHGMRSGKILDLSDESEIHAIIGLGHNKEDDDWQPNEQSRVVAEQLRAEAKDLGLRAVIGNDVFGKIKEYDPQHGGYVLDNTGRPKVSKLRAGGPGSSVNVAYDIMAEHGQQKPALQLELARLLRLNPLDLEKGGWHKDEKALAVGVHLGYLLCKKLVGLIATNQSA